MTDVLLVMYWEGRYLCTQKRDQNMKLEYEILD